MLTICGVSKDITCNVEILPDNQRLDSAKFESLKSVFDTEAIFPGIQTNLIEILLYEFFLLDELDVCKGFGCKFDGLTNKINFL